MGQVIHVCVASSQAARYDCVFINLPFWKKLTKRRTRIAQVGALSLAVGIIACAIGVALPLHDLALAPADPRALLIDGISIVDVRQGVVRPDQTIVIEHERIVYAGATSDAPRADGARYISGAGKFAMPGLWDMHVHTVDLSPQLHFPLLIATGVTSVRDMGDGCSFGGELDCKPVAQDWIKLISAHAMLAPRLVATASYHVEELEDGIVAALKARGDRLLKLQLERDSAPAQFHLLVRQAQQAGMVAAGHLPFSVDLLDPQLGPYHSIEHDESLLPQCSPPGGGFDGRTASKVALLERGDKARCGAVLSLMRARGIGYVPTHVGSSHQDWIIPRGDYKRDARLRFIPLPQRLAWRAYAAVTSAGTSDDDVAPIEQWYHAALKLTAQAQAAGVAVMAGSDAIDAYVTHGFGLHDELAQLVKAGLTPAQALRAATLTPAQHMGRNDLGSVETGKVADIVIVLRNPLDDIANAGAIDSVIVEGRLHERKALDAMLSFVEEQASSFSVNCKFLWAMLKPW